MQETEKDEHGCLIGKEVWDEDQGKCVTTGQNSKDIKNKAVKMSMDEALARIPPLEAKIKDNETLICLLYTSPSPRDRS